MSNNKNKSGNKGQNNPNNGQVQQKQQPKKQVNKPQQVIEQPPLNCYKEAPKVVKKLTFWQRIKRFFKRFWHS